MSAAQAVAPPGTSRYRPGDVPPDDPILAAYRAGFSAGRAHACVELAEMEGEYQSREWWNHYAGTVASWSFRDKALKVPRHERTVAQVLSVRRVRLVRLP